MSKFLFVFYLCSALSGFWRQGQRQHRCLVDRPRRRIADAAALPSQATPDLEELQAPDLQRGSGDGQLHPDEERSQDIPLPTQVRWFIYCSFLKSRPLCIQKNLLLTKRKAYTNYSDIIKRSL
jgi:hypothetical protein